MPPRGKSKRSSKGKSGCVLCKRSNEDELDFGGLLSTKTLQAHYFCLLLSESIHQSGKDNQGIWGFLNSDILTEVNDSKNKQCHYCSEFGASLACNRKNCKRKFHLPCGLMNRTQHDYEKFISYCHAHRKACNVPAKMKHKIGEYKCLICMENYNQRKNNFDLLVWADCCKKDVILHLACVKKLALSAGYFTKCPACNNNKEFIDTIKKFGVFVPERDASWEIGRNAFGDLLYRHNRCDMEKCACPRGRTYHHTAGNWKLILCELCGSFGSHKGCTEVNDQFVCKACNVESEAIDPSISNNETESANVPPLNSNDDNPSPEGQINSEDSDSDSGDVICISSDSDDHFSERESDNPPPEKSMLPKYNVCESPNGKRKLSDTSTNDIPLPKVAKKKTIYSPSSPSTHHKYDLQKQHQVARKSTSGDKIYSKVYTIRKQDLSDIKDDKLLNNDVHNPKNIMNIKPCENAKSLCITKTDNFPVCTVPYTKSESGELDNIKAIKKMIDTNLPKNSCIQFLCTGPVFLQCASEINAVEIDNNNEVEIANIPDGLRTQKNVALMNPKGGNVIVIDDSDDENATQFRISDVRSLSEKEPEDLGDSSYNQRERLSSSGIFENRIRSTNKAIFKSRRLPREFNYIKRMKNIVKIDFKPIDSKQNQW